MDGDLSKDSATLNNLKKLADALGGKFDGREFDFGEDSNNSNLFASAANLFLKNEHSPYFGKIKPQQNSSAVESNSKNVAIENQSKEVKLPSDENKTKSRFEIGTHTHTKTGAKMPKATLKERVEREDYLKLNALAKKHGGSYSKYAKAFLFSSENGRDDFVKEAEEIFADTPATKTNSENSIEQTATEDFQDKKKLQPRMTK